MRVNNSWKSLNTKKVEELERVAALSQGEARDIILSQTEEQLSKEIASRIRDAELEVKERSDKIAKTFSCKLCSEWRVICC